MGIDSSKVKKIYVGGIGEIENIERLSFESEYNATSEEMEVAFEFLFQDGTTLSTSGNREVTLISEYVTKEHYNKGEPTEFKSGKTKNDYDLERVIIAGIGTFIVSELQLCKITEHVNSPFIELTIETNQDLKITTTNAFRDIIIIRRETKEQVFNKR